MSLADEVRTTLAKAGESPLAGLPVRRVGPAPADDMEGSVLKLEAKIDAIAHLLGRIADEVDNLSERQRRL